MEVGRRKGRTYARPWAESYPIHSYSHWQSSVPVSYAQLLRKPLLKPSVSRETVFTRRKRDKTNIEIHKSAAKRPPSGLHSTRSFSISFPQLIPTPNPDQSLSPEQSSTGIQTDRRDYSAVRPSLKLPVLHLSFDYGRKSRDGLNYK